MTDEQSPPPAMTANHLRRAGEALYGPRWQSPMANDLGLGDPARIRQWLRGERPVPPGVRTDLLALLRARTLAAAEEMSRMMADQEIAGSDLGFVVFLDRPHYPEVVGEFTDVPAALQAGRQTRAENEDFSGSGVPARIILAKVVSVVEFSSDH
jgi:hypothetical protein